MNPITESTTVTTNALPFIAFMSDAGDVEVLKTFAAARGWHVDSCIFQGDIRSAIEFLRTHPSPTVLMVELPSQQEAPDLLSQLADVCAPEVKVIASGSINEYSFFCWLTELGIQSYALKPLTIQALDQAYAKVTSSPESQATGVKKRSTGKIIALTGVRGGVGASSIAINMAALIAKTTGKQVALIDLEPQDGSIALMLDLEPSKGLRESLERPERLDALFVERVMMRVREDLPLFVMSAEEPLHERISYHEGAATKLLKLLQEKYEVVVLDVARQLRPFAVESLKQTDHMFLVTELSLMGVRDTLRLLELYREHWHISMPTLIANKLGMEAKYQVSTADFEKGVNTKLAHTLPYAPDIFMGMGRDIPALKHLNSSAVKALTEILAPLFPEMVKAPEKEANFFSKLVKPKKA